MKNKRIGILFTFIAVVIGLFVSSAQYNSRFISDQRLFSKNVYAMVLTNRKTGKEVFSYSGIEKLKIISQTPKAISFRYANAAYNFSNCSIRASDSIPLKYKDGTINNPLKDIDPASFVITIFLTVFSCCMGAVIFLCLHKCYWKKKNALKEQSKFDTVIF